MNKLIFLFAGLVCLTLATTQLRSVEEVRGSVSGSSGDDDHYRAYEATWFPDNHPRIIQIKGVEADKTSSNTADLSAVEFDMSTVFQSTIEFLYYHADADIPANGGNITDYSATAFAFALRNFMVFEYVEGNGINGFQNGTNDNITGYYNLSSIDLPWNDLIINESQITGSDGNTYKMWFVTAQTTDEVFLIRFLVSGAPVQVGNVKLTPDSIKIDFVIRWFTDLHVPALWTTGPSNFANAQVGLLTGLAADAFGVNSTNGNETSNPSLTFGSSAAAGFFSYETKANVTITGEVAEGTVHAEVDTPNDPSTTAAFQAGWIIRVMWFSFEGYRPSEVVWDPEFGSTIDYSTSSSNMIQPCLFVMIVMWLFFN